jgi:hypothetical protein
MYDFVRRISPHCDLVPQQIFGICPADDLRVMPIDLKVLQLGYSFSKTRVVDSGCGKRQSIHPEHLRHVEEQPEYPIIVRLVIGG